METELRIPGSLNDRTCFHDACTWTANALDSADGEIG